MCGEGVDTDGWGGGDPYTTDLGLPTPLGAGEAEAFLEKGLLRTEVIMVVVSRDLRSEGDHRSFVSWSKGS